MAKSWSVIILSNKEVLKYLKWLKDQLPNHTSFAGAVHLFKALHGASHPDYATLAEYLRRPR